MIIREIRTLRMKPAHGILNLHWSLPSVQFGITICSGCLLKSSCLNLLVVGLLLGDLHDAFTLRRTFVWWLHSEIWNSSVLPKNLWISNTWGCSREICSSGVKKKLFFVRNLNFIKHFYFRIAFCHIYDIEQSSYSVEKELHCSDMKYLDF